MRLFVSEYLTGGAWPESLAGSSLVREGRAMLVAVLDDCARIPNCRTVTTWDERLGNFADDDVGVHHVVSHPDEELSLFRRLAAECDAVIVIAPESNGILAERRRLVDAVGGRFLGCSLETIELCADKLLLARHLQEAGIPTIETAVFEPGQAEPIFEYPIVVKPRGGAGSQETFLIPMADELARVNASLISRGNAGPFIEQPFQPGISLSVGVLQPFGSSSFEILPIAEQRLTSDGRFSYLGGTIPAVGAARSAIETIVRKAHASLPNPGGYVGYDLIIPDNASGGPVLVEINPRLTTSYVGYRVLAADNLMSRIVFGERHIDRIAWKPGAVDFLADGVIRHG